jgi:hypothetical protein
MILDRAYSKIKSLQYKLKNKSSVIKDKKGNKLISIDEVCDRWKEYIEELYQGKEIEEESRYMTHDLSTQIIDNLGLLTSDALDIFIEFATS